MTEEQQVAVGVEGGREGGKERVMLGGREKRKKKERGMLGGRETEGEA